MTEELDHSPAPRDHDRSGPGGAGLVVAAAIFVLLGYVGYRVLRRPAPPPQPPAPTVAEPEAPPAQVAPSTAAAATEVALGELPQLDDSDAWLGSHLAGLSADPLWARALRGEGLVRRFAAAALALAEGQAPKSLLDLLGSHPGFSVRSAEGRLWIDEGSFRRYDPYLDALESVDLDRGARIWRHVRPLADAAWNEIAPPGDTLDHALRGGIDRLLATPRPPARIAVVHDGNVHRYADPALEALAPAQKMLLRAGTERGERLRRFLAAVRDRI